MDRYSIPFTVNCPSNDQTIAYAFSIESNCMIMVEAIMSAINDLPAQEFHENIADALAKALPGRHTLIAHHHGVDIETVRGGA